MAKPPPAPRGVDAPPDDFALARPRDLHPVADIRLVITDIAKLTERIDNLIERVGDLKADGKETRDKLDGVKEDIAGFKGAIKVFGAIYTLALVVLGAFLAWYLRPDPAAPATAPVAPQTIAPQKEGAAEATPVVDPSPEGRRSLGR